MSFKAAILLEITVLSSSGHVSITTEQLEFNSVHDAEKYFDEVTTYEEVPGLKTWRSVTKLY